ncbi:MAG: valine--tRNA ligase [Defluviitaleaceae bacterium]|nr:valine--tRNA ligase [Defluviitaleaceae bacterium]
MDTKYNPKAVEDKLYAQSLEKGYFSPKVDQSKKPYTIMMPPPNITSRLHMGHAFEGTIIDVLTRFKRMQGYNALLMPGTDHAAIATEVKIVEDMAKDGVKKSDLGRDGFMERAWQWNDKYGNEIIEQIKKMGISADWNRARFTMDEGCSKAVVEVFVRLYEKGLIYRGERLVNWCTKCNTSISDAEVEHEDKQGGFWHFKYPIKGMDGEYATFATTRPETMLGDVAIAVHPDDERYKHLVGKLAIMPILDREIPIVADRYVKMDFGTGMVKITPAHDFNDFELGARHNLPKINIMNDDATINESGGAYQGLDRYEARKKIVDEMDGLGLFIKKEDITHSVGTHDRCKDVVEPLNKLQWFVKMESLAAPALKAYQDGNLNIVPPRFGKVYTHWLEDIKDWCVSRQLWWGHRIPAYHCGCCEHITVAKEPPAACPKCQSTNLKQDEDNLDTWFSSALWPFSTLGWPGEDSEDLKYFYPTDVLCCGYEILFFWVIRMVFSGQEFMGELPFKDVLIHGMMRDEQGRKMSKSLGNGIDPLDIVEQYGADALRFYLSTGNSMGNDLRFYIDKVEAARNFLNKIWNASRFIAMNVGEGDIPTLDNVMDSLTTADRWIISKCNATIAEVTQNLDNYDLGLAAQKINDFAWDELCDWYIEMVKSRLYNADDPTRPAAIATLCHVLEATLKLLHPFSPFITDEIFQSFGFGESVVVASWPIASDALNFAKEEQDVEQIKEAIKAIRNLRSEMNIPPSRKAAVYVVASNQAVRGVFEAGSGHIVALASASEVIVQDNKTGIDDNAVSLVVASAEIFMPLADLVDFDKERERLTKEIKKLEDEVARVASKLANQGFLSKAKPELIEEERAKEAKYKEMLALARGQLASL